MSDLLGTASSEYVYYVVRAEKLLVESTLWRHSHEESHNGTPENCQHPWCRQVRILMYPLSDKGRCNDARR